MKDYSSHPFACAGDGGCKRRKTILLPYIAFGIKTFLNPTLNDMFDILDAMTDENRKSFHSGYTETVLKPGTVLFRFCSHHEAKYSDCWTDKETLKLIFHSYHVRNSDRPFGNKRALVRAQTFNLLGVAKSWSSLEYLLTAKIKKDLVAYEGIIEKQSFFQDVDDSSDLKNITVRGGGIQYITPRIKRYARAKNLSSIHQYIVDMEFVRFTESSWYKRLVDGGHHL